MGSTHRHTLVAIIAVAALWGGAATAARAQQGTVAGQVTDQSTGTPLAGARLTVQGPPPVTSSNAEGRHTLRNVPAGAANGRATFIRHPPASRRPDRQLSA